MLKKESALKKQVKAQEGRADRLRASICGKKYARNALEEGMFSVKTLEDLNGEESRLERLNKEDQAIVEDEDAAPFDKEAAQERIEARNEELARLQARIEEGEVALPLREKIKEIFKKNGITLTAILLATGVTIGAVVGAITNALKAIGKALGSGLKKRWVESWFYSAWADRLDRELPFQNRGAGHRLYRRGHLAPDFGSGFLCGRKIPQKALRSVNGKQYTPRRRLLPPQQ